MVTTRRGTDTESPAPPPSSVRNGRKRGAGDAATPVPAKKGRSMVNGSSTKHESKETILDKLDSAFTPQGAEVQIDAAVSEGLEDWRQRKSKRKDSPEVVIYTSDDQHYGEPVRQGRPEKGISARKYGIYAEADENLAIEDTSSNHPIEDDGLGTPQEPSIYTTPGTSFKAISGSPKRILFGSEAPASVSAEDVNPRLHSPQIHSSAYESWVPGAEDDSDDEEPETAENSTAVETRIQDVDEDSDDEAPEVVTTAAAVESARAAEAEASRAVERQQAEIKRKRRDHDARRKEQAENSRRVEKQTLASVDTDAEKFYEESAPTSELAISRKNIPDLLPASLLAAEPVARSFAPISQKPEPPTSNKQLLSQHLKYMERQQKPPKDRKKGSLNVRVLAEENPLLPPKKADTRNTQRRAEWMMGRVSKNGTLGTGKMERRSTGGGFLRR